MKLEINDRLSGSGELELTRGSRANGTVEDIVLRADEGDELESLGRGEDLSLLLGQPFHRLTLEQALEECDKLVSLGGFWHVVTANTDFLAQSSRNQEAKSVLLGADRIFCDGMPLVWLSRLFAKGLPERVAGSDLTPKLLQRCAERGWGVFLFGTDEETMAVLKVRLAKLYPGLRLVGAIAPPYGRIEDWDNEAYVAEILAAKPSVFLAALGFPEVPPIQWTAVAEQANPITLTWQKSRNTMKSSGAMPWNCFTLAVSHWLKSPGSSECQSQVCTDGRAGSVVSEAMEPPPGAVPSRGFLSSSLLRKTAAFATRSNTSNVSARS